MGFLGKCRLSLKDRNVVAIAGCSILGREGVRDARQPLPEQHVDLVGRESIAELLQSSGIGTAQNAIVQGLEGYPFLGNYPKTLSSPGFYGGYTPFSDSYLASCRLTYSWPLMHSLAL